MTGDLHAQGRRGPVADNAAFPIVGAPENAYDTCLEQLVADAAVAGKAGSCGGRPH